MRAQESEREAQRETIEKLSVLKLKCPLPQGTDTTILDFPAILHHKGP